MEISVSLVLDSISKFKTECLSLLKQTMLRLAMTLCEQSLGHVEVLAKRMKSTALTSVFQGLICHMASCDGDQL